LKFLCSRDSIVGPQISAQQISNPQNSDP